MLRAEIQFTNTRNDGSVTVPIYLWEASFPQTVKNFVFACNAHLLSEADHQRQEAAVGSKLPPPLMGSSVVRVDGVSTVEFGTSATISVFGGFFPDEKDQQQQSSVPLKRKMPRLGGEEFTAGSLIMSNVGPNTNASRFILLLAPAPELASAHVCFGHVARVADLELLCAFFSTTSVKVNPKTLVPLNKITVTKCLVRRSSSVGGRDAPAEAPRQVSGTVRQREDDDDDNGGPSASSTHGQRRDDDDMETGQRALKKRRAEIVALNSEGELAPVTTAVPTPSGASFDMFAAQEAAFHNDLLDIKQSQLRKQHNHKNKAARFAAHVMKKGSNKAKIRKY